ncbi:MAG: hypothetical protein OET21_19020, partial [Desulfobacterales bacterium]|nr:hypothetical protein [Desulfobacterales bacterium]
MIDQIAHFDSSGRICKLEVDSNRDGVMDKFQMYLDGNLEKIESDRNYDQKIDNWDYFIEGKRTR